MTTFTKQRNVFYTVSKVAQANMYLYTASSQSASNALPLSVLVSMFVFSRLDYCNAILAGLPKTTITPLQHAQNAAARLVARLGPRDHVSNALRDLHWLPVQHHLQALLTYASCSQQSGAILPGQQCHRHSQSQLPRTTSVRK